MVWSGDVYGNGFYFVLIPWYVLDDNDGNVQVALAGTPGVVEGDVPVRASAWSTVKTRYR